DRLDEPLGEAQERRGHRHRQRHRRVDGPEAPPHLAQRVVEEEAERNGLDEARRRAHAPGASSPGRQATVTNDAQSAKPSATFATDLISGDGETNPSTTPRSRNQGRQPMSSTSASRLRSRSTSRRGRSSAATSPWPSDSPAADVARRSGVSSGPWAETN